MGHESGNNWCADLLTGEGIKLTRMNIKKLLQNKRKPDTSPIQRPSTDLTPT